MLREEFLTPLNLSQNALATGILVSTTRIGDIVNSQRAITPEYHSAPGPPLRQQS
jgi:addiction module HigA family antidote